MIAATVGLLAATPVDVAWDDGCNDHGGRAAVVVAPVIEHRRPAAASLAYEDESTLVACVNEPR
jgi:hypothetical protein